MKETVLTRAHGVWWILLAVCVRLLAVQGKGNIFTTDPRWRFSCRLPARSRPGISWCSAREAASTSVCCCARGETAFCAFLKAL